MLMASSRDNLAERRLRRTVETVAVVKQKTIKAASMTMARISSPLMERPLPALAASALRWGQPKWQPAARKEKRRRDNGRPADPRRTDVTGTGWPRGRRSRCHRPSRHQQGIAVGRHSSARVLVGPARTGYGNAHCPILQ